MLPTPGPVELIIILVIALIILGPGRLPDVGSALGKSIREFRKASSDIQDSVKVDISTKPVATTDQASAPAATTTTTVAASAPADVPSATSVPSPSSAVPSAPSVPSPSSAGAPSSEPSPGTR